VLLRVFQTDVIANARAYTSAVVDSVADALLGEPGEDVEHRLYIVRILMVDALILWLGWAGLLFFWDLLVFNAYMVDEPCRQETQEAFDDLAVKVGFQQLIPVLIDIVKKLVMLLPMRFIPFKAYAAQVLLLVAEMGVAVVFQKCRRLVQMFFVMGFVKYRQTVFEAADRVE
jgi:hypothetical protein